MRVMKTLALAFTGAVCPGPTLSHSATPVNWPITIGKGLVISYGTDGKELWRLQGMTQATPSPVCCQMFGK